MPQIELKRVRLQSWGGQIWNPKGFEGSDPAYAAHFIFAKDHVDSVLKIPTLTMIENAMKAAAVDTFGTKADAMLKAAKLNSKVPVHDGDTKPDSDGYAGNMFLSSRRKGTQSPPRIVHRKLNADGSLIDITQADGVIYDGCIVNAIIDIYGYTTGSNGIAAGLRGVRFVEDGDAFGSGAPVQASAFSTLSDEVDIEL